MKCFLEIKFRNFLFSYYFCITYDIIDIENNDNVNRLEF